MVFRDERGIAVSNPIIQKMWRSQRSIRRKYSQKE